MLADVRMLAAQALFQIHALRERSKES